MIINKKIHNVEISNLERVNKLLLKKDLDKSCDFGTIKDENVICIIIKRIENFNIKLTN